MRRPAGGVQFQKQMVSGTDQQGKSLWKEQVNHSFQGILGSRAMHRKVLSVKCVAKDYLEPDKRNLESGGPEAEFKKIF